MGSFGRQQISIKLDCVFSFMIKMKTGNVEGCGLWVVGDLFCSNLVVPSLSFLKKLTWKNYF